MGSQSTDKHCIDQISCAFSTRKNATFLQEEFFCQDCPSTEVDNNSQQLNQQYFSFGKANHSDVESDIESDRLLMPT